MTVCGWVGRDPDGRPFCVHGPAHRNGRSWICRAASYAKIYRFRATEKGRLLRQREHQRPHYKSADALRKLTEARMS